MELRHHRYFLAVAEELHFGRAAERLKIAQPALSIQIRQLEDSLGGQLFHRANRGVTLTEAGRILLDEARQTLDRAARAEEVVRRAVRGELAAIQIGYSANAALSGILGRGVRAIREASPDLEIRVHELDPQTQLEDLVQRKIHFALTTTLSLDVPSQLVATRLAAWPLLVALPQGHPLAEQDEIAAEMLRDESFIVYSGSSADDGFSVFRTIAGFTPKAGQRSTSALMVLALVGAGLGVALVPSSLQEAAPHEGVVFRKLKSTGAMMDCSLVSWKVEFEPAVKHAATVFKRAVAGTPARS